MTLLFVLYVNAAVKYCDLSTSDVLTNPEQFQQEEPFKILVWTYGIKEKNLFFFSPFGTT